MIDIISGNIGYSPNGNNGIRGEKGLSSYLANYGEEEGGYTLNEKNIIILNCYDSMPVININDYVVIMSNSSITTYIIDSKDGKNLVGTNVSQFSHVSQISESLSFGLALKTVTIKSGIKIDASIYKVGNEYKGAPVQYAYTNVSFLSPYIYSATFSEDIRNIKIVGEFVCNDKSYVMQSETPRMFKTPKVSGIPFISDTIFNDLVGYAKNYSIGVGDSGDKYVSYNRMCPEDCVIILKDWTDSFNTVNNKALNMSFFNDVAYYLYLYIYTKNSLGVCSKRFLKCIPATELFKI